MTLFALIERYNEEHKMQHLDTPPTVLFRFTYFNVFNYFFYVGEGC